MAMMWRPGKASRGVLALVAFVSLLGYAIVEALPHKTSKGYYREKIKAARVTARGMDVIKRARTAIFGRIDVESDPAATGVIGSGLTPITSKEGVLTAKQTAANPNFAAVMVSLFKKAKLKEGDAVAFALSGSFPSLNLAGIVAAETLGLVPLIISSNSASRWGANDPELTWLDMERLLFENDIIHHRSLAASIGGEEDRGYGIPPDGVRLLRESIKRNGTELIDPPDLESSFDQRMNIYREAAGDRPIACYVNIGGGAGSVGSELLKQLFAPGLQTELPAGARLRDSVMTRLSRDGVPVINIYNIARLAKRFGLPVKPTRPQLPGEGGIYAAMAYNMILVWVVLIFLVAFIFLMLRMDLNHYVLLLKNALGNGRKKAGSASPPAPPSN